MALPSKREKDKPPQGAVAITLAITCWGAVGFIDWLGLDSRCSQRSFQEHYDPTTSFFAPKSATRATKTFRCYDSHSTMEPENYEALAELRYLGRKFLRLSKEFLRTKADLNPEQYEALLAIRVLASVRPLTIGQLSERLQVKHHSAINIVNRLTERKLVTRSVPERNRRQRHLELTAQGETLIQELASAHHTELCKRRDEMIRALQRIR